LLLLAVPVWRCVACIRYEVARIWGSRQILAPAVEEEEGTGVDGDGDGTAEPGTATVGTPKSAFVVKQ
jgi:hypothetical protein